LSIVISRLIFEIGNCSARHTADSAVRADGGHHPSRRFVGGLVVAEVGDADIVDIVGAHGFHVCIGEQPAAVGAGENVAAEINALVSGVDDVALRVDQKRVLEPVPRDDLAEEVVEPGIGGRPCLPSRVIVLDRRVRVGEGRGVARLQVSLRVRRGQQCVDIDGMAGLRVLDLGEHIVVVVHDRLLLHRVDWCVRKLVEPADERVHGLTGRPAAGIHNE
jgi:hypothetical protein